MSTTALALLVVIRLYDPAGTPDRELSVAMETTTGTLRTAHLQVEWVVCPPHPNRPWNSATGCVAAPRAGELIVRIMRTPALDVVGETLGDAVVDKAAGRGTLATIYADRIDRLAADAGVDRGLLLGRAMAHEVGHRLLGTTTHPPRGLMRAKWASAELRRGTPRDWLFSTSEARALRRRIVEGLAVSKTRRY